jgi:hypothetical protein
MTNEDFMERICVELTELNTTLNCRFDVLDDIATHLKAIAYGSDLAIVEDRLSEIEGTLRQLNT